jgi:hypothetical protein
MAITVKERWSGRRSRTSAGVGSVEVGFLVMGTDDDEQARAALIANAPSIWLVDGNTLPLTSTSVEQISGDLWEGVAGYESSSYTQPKTNDTAFSFDTTGGTQHLSQSYKTVSQYATPADAGHTFPDMGGSIGNNGDEIVGVDVTCPVFTFGATLYREAAAMTPAYVANLYRLTGKTNVSDTTMVLDGLHFSFNAGELLYLGAQGGRRGQGDVEINHRFAFSENRDDIKIGDIAMITKAGWDYVWVRYENKVIGDGPTKTIARIPRFAYVEQVYKTGNFALLQIPSS